LHNNTCSSSSSSASKLQARCLQSAAAAAMSSMAVYQPQCLLREVAVDPRQAAVLFIDVQNLNCHRGGAIYRNHTQEELEVWYFVCFFVSSNIVCMLFGRFRCGSSSSC
jgi:hypothetical protein